MDISDDIFPDDMVKRGRKPRLTSELVAKICSFIEQGAYDWVAARACGVHKSTFYRWLVQGEVASSGIYREFCEQVHRARAQARLAAEIEVRRDDPKFWLRCGPGKERPGEPGWTDSAKFVPTKERPDLTAQTEQLMALRAMTGDERDQLDELLEAEKKLYETAKERLRAGAGSNQQGPSTTANGTGTQH